MVKKKSSSKNYHIQKSQSHFFSYKRCHIKNALISNLQERPKVPCTRGTWTSAVLHHRSSPRPCSGLRILDWQNWAKLIQKAEWRPLEPSPWDYSSPPGSTCSPCTSVTPFSEHRLAGKYLRPWCPDWSSSEVNSVGRLTGWPACRLLPHQRSPWRRRTHTLTWSTLLA